MTGNRAARSDPARRIGGAMAGLCFSTGLAQAALAPEWQRVREFQAVIERAAAVLPGRPIEAVERLGAGRFRVRAGGCRLDLRVVDQPRSDPGPHVFTVEPGTPDCR